MGHVAALVNPSMPEAFLKKIRRFSSSPVEFIRLEASPSESFPLFGHPDIIGAVCGRIFFHCPCLKEPILEKIRSFHIKTIRGTSFLKKIYPADVPYNSLIIENQLLLHNLRSTDDSIKNYVRHHQWRFLDVPQGYTRCSVVPVDKRSFITDDDSISRSLKSAGYRVCQITKGFVRLKGYPYGFIGGASACLDDKVFFFGDIRNHPGYASVRDFIKERGKKVVSIGSCELEDFGGIHFFKSE
ncbi:MAG: hypothetical protein JW928_06960 [Candidatus Aureabacteria bacterium]|nr:hypothetical protein [Candidatus Auribacterota bacterium]